MDAIIQAGARFARMTARLDFAKDSLTLIVKGTFELSPGGVAAPADEQPFPTRDQFDADDDETHGDRGLLIGVEPCT